MLTDSPIVSKKTSYFFLSFQTLFSQQETTTIDTTTCNHNYEP